MWGKICGDAIKVNVLPVLGEKLILFSCCYFGLLVSLICWRIVLCIFSSICFGCHLVRRGMHCCRRAGMLLSSHQYGHIRAGMLLISAEAVRIDHSESWKLKFHLFDKMVRWRLALVDN